MNGSKIFFIIACTGILMWNIPETESLFYNQHSFYNGSAPCEKCHQDIVTLLNDGIEPHPQHNEIGCRVCHSRDGNQSHAARIVVCTECHNEGHQQQNPTCRNCHDSHGALIVTGAPTVTLTAAPTITLTAAPTSTLSGGG